MVDKAGGLKGARYAPTASGGKPLTPPSLTHRSLCHAVYARLLHSGIETAPGMEGLDNPAFERSARIIQKTLTSEYLLFKETKQLNLFDASLSPLGTIERIETFIDENPDINDFLFYYCGHGSYLRDRSYFLRRRSAMMLAHGFFPADFRRR